MKHLLILTPCLLSAVFSQLPASRSNTQNLPVNTTLPISTGDNCTAVNIECSNAYISTEEYLSTGHGINSSGAVEDISASADRELLEHYTSDQPAKNTAPAISAAKK